MKSSSQDVALPLGSRVAALLVAAAIALAAHGAPAAAETPVVKLVQVTPDSGALRRVFFGKVVAQKTVDLAFQVSGQVVQFPVEEGAAVPKDGMVAEMDLEPFQVALKEAIVTASTSRLRLVFLAAATTILGMLPLLTDAFFQSMAATIMGGLAFASVLTLIAAPVFYFVMFREADRRARDAAGVRNE